MVREALVHPDVIANVEMRNVVRICSLPFEGSLFFSHAKLRLALSGECGEEGGELGTEHDVVGWEGSEDAPVDGEEIHEIVSTTNSVVVGWKV